MKKRRPIQRPWYDNGAREGWDPCWGHETLTALAASRKGMALLESYCRLYRRKL